MAGISTTGVVLSSVAWASDADYDVRLVQDCCYDPDRDAHGALLRSGFGGRVQVVVLRASHDRGHSRRWIGARQGQSKSGCGHRGACNSQNPLP